MEIPGKGLFAGAPPGPLPRPVPAPAPAAPPRAPSASGRTLPVVPDAGALPRPGASARSLPTPADAPGTLSVFAPGVAVDAVKSGSGVTAKRPRASPAG